ncbi:MAG: uroporphyrinogen decarboxylase [Rhizobiales bacterium]|nr:uroporphyrinogen decarboxylase [Hyphomicrobiales bacterium]
MQAEEKSPHGRVRAVLDGKRFDPPPVWMMRQAGRYLPEYRQLRARVGSFLDLCFDPELATEVTLQPVERFDLDAAILFSDILVIPLALGRKVAFVEGEGPKLEPIDADGIERLEREHVLERLAPVLDTVASARARLSRDKTLIGFCGAPWTVATYMVAGEGTADQLPARLMAAREPDTFQWLIDRLTVASAAYLAAQIRAGADCVQIFDTWSGVLGTAEFDRWCIEPTRAIVELVRHAEPSARIIGFPKGAGLRLKRYAEMTGVDGIGLDWTVPPEVARDTLQPLVAVQGNLDPAVLLAGGDTLAGAIDGIREALSGGRFIFNLGHGILPQTPITHVEEMLARIRGAS